jgi:hypothetical protein
VELDIKPLPVMVIIAGLAPAVKGVGDMEAIAGSGFWGGGGVDEEPPPPHAHSRIAVRHKNRPTHKYSQMFRGWSCRTMSTSQFVVVNKIRYENIVKIFTRPEEKLVTPAGTAKSSEESRLEYREF